MTNEGAGVYGYPTTHYRAATVTSWRLRRVPVTALAVGGIAEGIAAIIGGQ